MLLIDSTDAITTLTLNRAETMNPLGAAGDGDVFAAACDAINADMDVRCVILTGAGRAFSAGGDIKAMKDKTGNFGGNAPTILASGAPKSTAPWTTEVASFVPYPCDFMF